MVPSIMILHRSAAASAVPSHVAAAPRAARRFRSRCRKWSCCRLPDPDGAAVPYQWRLNPDISGEGLEHTHTYIYIIIIVDVCWSMMAL